MSSAAGRMPPSDGGIHLDGLSDVPEPPRTGDLGYPEPDTHLLKAELVARIDEVIRECGLRREDAAKLLGLSQPDVSRLLRGNFRDYSIERLLRLLTVLGRDVRSVIRRARSRREGRLSVGPSEIR